MKIDSSQIAMGASYSKVEVSEEKESLKYWKDTPQKQGREGDGFLLSKKYQDLKIDENSEEQFEGLDPELQKIILALEILTGQKIRLKLFKPLQETASQESQPQRLGWGLEYNYEKTELSIQKLQFASKGSVTLEDGREIDFGVKFTMQQSQMKHTSISLKAGDALIDPLVIKFQDGAVNFSQIKTNLDLDLDGKSEEFSFVGSGSGFLMLDKNNDGKVNDGSELFGPNSGDGFEDLSVYDQDKNSWIDENDAVFEKLQIWTKDQNGEDKYYSLKDLGIGALYLQNVATPFEFEEGEMAKSSIFLRENGSVGITSEIDLKV